MNKTSQVVARNNSGMTIVEVVISIMIVMIFVTAIVEISAYSSQLSVHTERRARARDLAYSNLRVYSEDRLDWVVCGNVSPNPQIVTMNSPHGIGVPSVTQTIELWAPYGCSGANALMPIRVTSRVVYGTSNEEVEYVTYGRR